MPPYYSARIRADGNFVSWDEAVQPDPLDYDERWEITAGEILFFDPKRGIHPHDLWRAVRR